MRAKEKDSLRWAEVYELERYRKEWIFIQSHNSFEGEDADVISTSIQNLQTIISALKAFRPYEEEELPDSHVKQFEADLANFKTKHGLWKA